MIVDVQFTSRFWGKFHEDLGTRIQFSTAFHPQTDGQSERTIQTLENMMRACVLDFGSSWDTYLQIYCWLNSRTTTVFTPALVCLRTRCCAEEGVELPSVGEKWVSES